MSDDNTSDSEYGHDNSQTTPQVDRDWNFSCVTFQVENKLFTVLKEAFMVPDSPFPALFEECTSEEPILLEDVHLQDFRAFLRALFPNLTASAPLEDKDTLIGALHVANKWGFKDIRNKAIVKLDQLIDADAPYIKIRLGKHFLVREWVQEGLSALIQNTDLDIAELQAEYHGITQETISKIFYVQACAGTAATQNVEKFKSACRYCGLGTTTHHTGDAWKREFRKAAASLIYSTFAEDLDGLRYLKHIQLAAEQGSNSF